MQWWLWLVLGLVLVGIELLTPGGFFVIFFGAAAILLGVLGGLGLSGPMWLQWLLFSALSILSLVFFRAPLMRRFRLGESTGPAVDTLVGEVGVVVEPPGADGYGKIELRGATWTARNSGATPLTKGARCRVTRVEGLTLWIESKGGSS
jgi:hypothetical protein